MAFTRVTPITITYPLVGTLTDFQLLVSGTFPFLAIVANGGVVTNASGFDLGFYADAGALTKLDWEIERWIPTTGEVIAWVRVPSFFTGQVIYLAAGDAAIITDQSNKTGVWVTTSPGGSGYRMVLHLPDTALQYTDSALFAQNATPTAAPGSIVGQIDGGISLNGTTQFLSVSGASYTQVTLRVYVSCWFYPTAFPASTKTILQKDPNFLNYTIKLDSTGHLVGGANTRDFAAAVSSVPLTLNAWNHLLAGWEGGAGNPQSNFVVLNGVRTNAADPYDSGGYTGLDPLYIGANSIGAPEIPGQIDEVRLWTAPAWSQARATAEYLNQINPTTFFSLPTGNPGCVITL